MPEPPPPAAGPATDHGGTRAGLRTVGDGDRPGLEALWQMFRHDLSEFDRSRPLPDGSFGRERLRAALVEPDREALLIVHEERVTGFALVRGLLGPCRVMSGFFVVRTARRTGVGAGAAHRLTAAHPGPWEIPFQEDNTAAGRFWRRVARRAAPGRWTEERRPVPGRPDLPPDTWIRLTVVGSPGDRRP